MSIASQGQEGGGIDGVWADTVQRAEEIYAAIDAIGASGALVVGMVTIGRQDLRFIKQATTTHFRPQLITKDPDGEAGEWFTELAVTRMRKFDVSGRTALGIGQSDTIPVKELTRAALCVVDITDGRLPTEQFRLLSLLAIRGAGGLLQPPTVKSYGQSSSELATPWMAESYGRRLTWAERYLEAAG